MNSNFKSHGLLLGLMISLSSSCFAGPDDGLTCSNAFGDKWSKSHKQWDHQDASVHKSLTRDLFNGPAKDESPSSKDLRRNAQSVAMNQALEFTVKHHQPGLVFDGIYDVWEASKYITRAPGNFLAFTLGKSEFAPLRAELGSQGFWLLFRSYSFPKLGFPNTAIPHMSVMIGERVYEIGRVSKMQPSGPIAISLDDYLYKARLSEQELNAKPGLFFGVWISGVKEETLQHLAEYYEGRAKEFSLNKTFNYSVSPDSEDSDNCMTYLNKPMIDLQNQANADKIGINGFFRTPAAMLSQFDWYLDPQFAIDRREKAPVFLFVDDDWLKETKARVPNEHELMPLPSFWGSHPQLKGYFLDQNPGLVMTPSYH